jgi:PD-(D/E)XK nuclease superfamily
VPHEIHTSERRSFRGCRRRWNWIFRENWYPFLTAKPLEFGVAFHEAMEVYYNPETWSWDREVIQDLAILCFEQKCQLQKQKYLVQKEDSVLDTEVEEDYAERVALGIGMLNHYFTFSPTLDKNFKPVKTEISFRVPIKNPVTGETLICKCKTCLEENPEGQIVYYAGRIDCLVEDLDGWYWIVDWKTATQLSQTQEFLDLDDQVGSYPWALRELGLRIRGFLYVELRKGFPKPPKENVNRRLGCLFSVAKNQETDYATFLKTVSEQDKEAYEEGLYDAMLTFLQNDGIKYHQRFEVHKSDYQLDQIGYNLFLEAKEMLQEDLPIYPSPGRFACNFCAFRQPCLGVNSGEDYIYTLETLFERRKHYYVRDEASTESKGGE